MKNKLNIQSSRRLLIIVLLWQCMAIMACKKFITIETSHTSVSTVSAFKDNASAIQVVTGLYGIISLKTDNGHYFSTTVLPELYADNLSLLNNTQYLYGDYYTNSLESQYVNTGSEGSTYWSVFYNQLYTVNTAIEQLKGNVTLSEPVAKRLLGEVYFLRAFYYFYLVNFYGEVPLVLTTEYEKTRSLAKSSMPIIYGQIESDLSAAEGLLNQTYVSGNLITSTPDRIRPNLAAVHALKARVYLYEKKYADAEAAASLVINTPAYSLNNPEAAFLKNSSETIWAVPSVRVGYNTYEGSVFILPATGPNDEYPFFVSKSLLKSFTPGDARKNNWLGIVNANNVDYYYPSKYKVPFIPSSTDFRENDIILRLSEMYLIRAEARNEQGKIGDAVSDLNALRANRRATPTAQVGDPLPAFATTLTQVELRSLILQERRVELFTEGGHRLFDLRRSGTMNAVMTEEHKEKGGVWAAFKAYFPIARFELSSNPNMKQTPGYAD